MADVNGTIGAADAVEFHIHEPPSWLMRGTA